MTLRPGPPRACARLALATIAVLAAAPSVYGDEHVVTIVADYEDDSVATRIADVENVAPADCAVRMAAIPARGQRSLMVEIGATVPKASVACDLCFRLATPFDQADRVATYAWIKEGSVDILYRVSDAAGQLFETSPVPLKTRHRWVRLVADLSPNKLKPLARNLAANDSVAPKPTWPIQIQGYRIRTHGIGRQTVYLDDLQVEHRAAGAATLRGEFKLDEPTHIYEPGALVRAAVVLENISRRRALPLTVQLAWLRSDASELTSTRASINLPASGVDYRSRQAVDFSRRITHSGLYRLVARVRGLRWISPAVFETTIAVTRSNRTLPRGRATFFGVQTNLIREPPADQLLEIDVARGIGVQLLALETPWRIVEPGLNSFDFAALDKLVNLISQRDIATMIVLTEPPEWLEASGIDWWDRQAVLFEALAQRYGKRICTYQPLTPDPSERGSLSAADLAAVRQIRSRVTNVRPDADVHPPPLLVQATDSKKPPPLTLPTNAETQLAFETVGDSASALAALQTFATQNRFEWRRSHRWFHRSESLVGSGAPYDAVAVLRHYVRAAAEGVGGVVWFDLRDDTNDTRHPEDMKGLVQRDFSPKTPLLGFANAVGMLHGLLYVGAVPGAPAEFESALFIGGNRQVAVLFPRPSRVLPAVLAPFQLVPGELTVFDFDRRARPLARSVATPLVTTLPGPLFVTLDCQRAQAHAKLGLARPWLRVPATVYCGKQSTFRIEIDAPANLRRSYLQLALPSDAPVESDFSARALRARAGDTLSFDVALTRTGDPVFAPTSLTLRLSLEGTSLRVPVAIRPLVDIRPIKAAASITDAAFAIGRLTPPDPDEQEQTHTAHGLHVAYQSRTLHIAVALGPGASPSASLQLGIAVENSERHAEVRIENLTGRPTLSPTFPTDRSQTRGWRCLKRGDKAADTRFCHVTIPASSLGLPRFQLGTRLLLAIRYVEPQPESGMLPFVLEWGAGLDGSHSTANYHWLRLAGTPAGR